MAKIVGEAAEVNARIVYWGIEGAGKRTSLQQVAAKLRPDHRGELTETPTRFDPSVGYTVLPIELGDIAGTRTRIELVAVPGGAEQGPTRKQLLDAVDGIVLVIDAQDDRIEENAAIVDELRKSLHDYARRLEDLPLVVQYNKRDLCDAYVIDELHRRMNLGGATVFETVATESTGVLQSLSTISKKVIRALREESIGPHQAMSPLTSEAPPAAPPEPPPTPPSLAAETVEFAALEDEPELSPTAQLEEAILAEAEALDAGADAGSDAARALLDQPWHEQGDALEPPLGARITGDLSIVSVGQATRADERSVRVPIVLGDAEGETSTVVLTLRIDPLVDESAT